MTQVRKIQRTLLAAAIGALLPMSAAHALEFLGNKIDTDMSEGRAPVFDASKYDRIEFLGNTAWTPKAGAQGPVRTETMGTSMASSHDYKKLDILGNIFWLPKTQ